MSIQGGQEQTERSLAMVSAYVPTPLTLNLANIRLDSEQDVLHYIETVCKDDNTSITSVLFGSSLILSLSAYEMILTQLLPKSHETLMHLSMANSKLDSKVAAYVSLLLGSQGVLRSLDLSNNHFGDIGAASIASSFHDQSLQQNMSLLSLSSLNLSGNSIGDTGAIALSRGISAFLDQCKESTNLTPKFTSLNLDNNKLGDNAAISISRFLRKFPVNSLRMRELSLNGNNIMEKGMIALLQALEDCGKNSLCILKLSNNHPTTAVLHQIGDLYMQNKPNNLALQHLEISFSQKAAKKILSDDLFGYTQALEKMGRGLNSSNINLSCLYIGELQLETFQASLDPNLDVEARKMLQLAIKVLDSIDMIYHWVENIGPQVHFNDIIVMHEVNTGVVSTKLEDPFSPHKRLPSIKDIYENDDVSTKTPTRENKDEYLWRLRERSARKFSEVSADIQKINTPVSNSKHEIVYPTQIDDDNTSIPKTQQTPDIRFFDDGNSHMNVDGGNRSPLDATPRADDRIHGPTSLKSQVHDLGKYLSNLQNNGTFVVTASELNTIVNDAVTTALKSAHEEWFSNIVSSPPPISLPLPPSPPPSPSSFSTKGGKTLLPNDDNQYSYSPFFTTTNGNGEDMGISPAQMSSKSKTERVKILNGSSVERREEFSKLQKKIEELEKRIATIENDYEALNGKVAKSMSHGVEGRGFRGIVKRLEDLNKIEKRMCALEHAVENEHMGSIHVLDMLLQQLQTSPRK